MKTILCVCISGFFVATLVAQGPGAPRVGPVPESQWTDEQRAIATQFASSGMTNAIATYLHYPALAQALLTHERYISTASTLPPRHRLLLGLRTAWLARSDYVWAHRAAAARREGLTATEITSIARVPNTLAGRLRGRGDPCSRRTARRFVPLGRVVACPDRSL